MEYVAFFLFVGYLYFGLAASIAATPVPPPGWCAKTHQVCPFEQ